MPAPQHPRGGRAAYPHGMTGMDVYDSEDLGPIAQSVRDAFGPHTPHPVPSSAAIAALFVAIHELEQRLTQDD